MAHPKGFTLIELLVVIASVVILATLLLPALAGTRQNSQVIGCLANQKRLAAGWIMYARDNNDVLVPNRGLAGQSPLTVNPLTNPDLQPGGQYAQWCPGNMRTLQIALYYDQWIKAGLLYPYLSSLSVYHCPADLNRIPSAVAPPFRKPAPRTYSMNAWVQSMDGAGYQTAAWNGIAGYVVYTKLANMTRPGPGKTWVFMEESSLSIDDAYFALNPAQPTVWYGLPAVLHGDASMLAFADGHADAHRWTDGNMIHGASGNTNEAEPAVLADPTSHDLSWLISITTVHQ
jgi:prepilin-type N-terminal cleavage/methylation domain-containing protein/prepilin-type processing-associated H-X9-DG protein